MARQVNKTIVHTSPNCIHWLTSEVRGAILLEIESAPLSEEEEEEEEEVKV